MKREKENDLIFEYPRRIYIQEDKIENLEIMSSNIISD